MSANIHHDPEELRDVYSLVLSSSRAHGNVLNNDQIFSRAQEKHWVKLTRFDSENIPSTHTFTDASQLLTSFDTHVHNQSHPSPSMEIYSLHQQNTWAPLNASRDMISALISHYRLSPGFLHMLACFRDRYLPTEESFPGASRSMFTADRAEFGWVYKYSENKQVANQDPWRIRHTGIYSVLDGAKAKTTVFIINPSPIGKFQDTLNEILQHEHFRSNLLASPILLHAVLISTHLSSWREYLEYYETSLLKLDMKFACTFLEQPLVTFNSLKEIRAIERKVLPLDPILASFDGLAVDLIEANCVFSSTNDENDVPCTTVAALLNDFRKEAASYRNQALHIRRQAQSTAQSVLDSLNLGSQQNMFLMTRSSREDSVAIRAITLVTSFYLPFSFVASMFGMNLVAFDSDSRKLLVSNQLWLFFVTSIPLTVVTLVGWRCMMRMYREGYLMEEGKHVKDAKSMKMSPDVEMGVL